MLHFCLPWRRTLGALLIGLMCPAAVVAEELSAASSGAASFHSAYESILTVDLRRHVNVLADDTFEGREAGQRGGRAAAGYLVKRLEQGKLAGAGDDGSYYQPFGPGYRNLLALLEGSDPELKSEIIVVSAHYDHVGYGNSRNSYGPWGYIHNGADDNASGVAAQLELIDAFSQLEPHPKRTILFAFWDAEELGLLGSKHWVAHPTLPLRRVQAMVNLDMVGRLVDRSIEVYGVRTCRGFRQLVCRHNREADLSMDFTWEIKDNSDHHPFFEQGVPVLMLHTGLHKDYHTPRDDADKLNIEGMRLLATSLFSIVHELANTPEQIAFRSESRNETVELQKQVERPAPPIPSRLGVTWDTRDTKPGLLLLSVATDSAAEQAGLRPGDRIVRFDGHDVTEGDEFKRQVLAAPNAVNLAIERDGEDERSMPVKLHGGPVRVGVTWRTDDAEPDCVILTQVLPDSPAALAGLRVNDRVFEFAGEAIDSGEKFRRLSRELSGQQTLSVERNGRIRTVKIELPNPASPDSAQSVSDKTRR